MVEQELNDLIKIMSELVIKSEGRVDRTNEIISNAFSTIDRISTEFTLQIQKLQSVRDELSRQNGDLIKLLGDAKKEIDILNKRYDSLLDKSLTLLNNKGNSENNINVR